MPGIQSLLKRGSLGKEEPALHGSPAKTDIRDKGTHVLVRDVAGLVDRAVDILCREEGALPSHHPVKSLFVVCVVEGVVLKDLRVPVGCIWLRMGKN